MSSDRLLRSIALLSVLLFLGAPGGAFAAPNPDPTLFSQQDLDDDDGDGIPNYLDPDDNNDGITDEDTPPEETPETDPHAEETPETDPPAEETPETEPADDEGETPVQEPPTTDPNPNESPAPPAPVTSLPNTGFGTPTPLLPGAGTITILSVLLLLVAPMWISRHLRKP